MQYLMYQRCNFLKVTQKLTSHLWLLTNLISIRGRGLILIWSQHQVFVFLHIFLRCIHPQLWKEQHSPGFSWLQTHNITSITDTCKKNSNKWASYLVWPPYRLSNWPHSVASFHCSSSLTPEFLQSFLGFLIANLQSIYLFYFVVDS